MTLLTIIVILFGIISSHSVSTVFTKALTHDGKTSSLKFEFGSS